MSIPISPISVPASIGPAGPAANAGGGAEFRDILNGAIRQVENSGAAANQSAQNYLTGGNQELHSAILASQTAQLDLEMFLQVRNKVVSAYEEIMRMQV